MALVKYNNNSISSVTSAASFPAGAMTLIKTITASSDSTISFVDGSSDVVLDSTYPIYMFTFNNIHPATNGVHFSFQGNAAGGSGFDETITSTAFFAQHREDDSSTSLDYRGDDDLAQSTSFQRLSESLGNANDESLSGTLQIFNPSSTTFVKHFIATINYIHQSDRSYNFYIAGYFNTASAIDEIQFKMSSGNVDAGTIKLYGIKDS
tara:strand:+ start:947 stop:1570 length:624 start_codon:yes stop_codon:yes gene_type:complete